MNNAEILAAATDTLTLMTASRMAEGMTADDAFWSALESFCKMCEER